MFSHHVNVMQVSINFDLLNRLLYWLRYIFKIKICLLCFITTKLLHNLFSEYRGYSCEDDSEAAPHSIQLLYTCLLSLSNLAFVPSIVIAVYRHYYVEAVVYFSNMFFSGVSKVFSLYNYQAVSQLLCSIISTFCNLLHYRMYVISVWLLAVMHFTGTGLTSLQIIHS